MRAWHTPSSSAASRRVTSSFSGSAVAAQYPAAITGIELHKARRAVRRDKGAFLVLRSMASLASSYGFAAALASVGPVITVAGEEPQARGYPLK